MEQFINMLCFLLGGTWCRYCGMSLKQSIVMFALMLTACLTMP